MPKKPKNKREWALYRCSLHCQIGRNAYKPGYVPEPGRTPTDYAVYCLLKAVEELATAMTAPSLTEHVTMPLLDRVKELEAKNERLATLCRAMLRFLEVTGAHSVGDHKNCTPCQFEKELEEIENGKV